VIEGCSIPSTGIPGTYVSITSEFRDYTKCNGVFDSPPLVKVSEDLLK
jgi:hypothetical protein